MFQIFFDLCWILKNHNYFPPHKWSGCSAVGETLTDFPGILNLFFCTVWNVLARMKRKPIFVFLQTTYWLLDGKHQNKIHSSKHFEEIIYFNSFNLTRTFLEIKWPRGILICFSFIFCQCVIYFAAMSETTTTCRLGDETWLLTAKSFFFFLLWCWQNHVIAAMKQTSFWYHDVLLLDVLVPRMTIHLLQPDFFV